MYVGGVEMTFGCGSRSSDGERTEDGTVITPDLRRCLRGDTCHTPIPVLDSFSASRSLQNVSKQRARPKRSGSFGIENILVGPRWEGAEVFEARYE